MVIVGLLAGADFLFSPYRVAALVSTPGVPTVIGSQVFPGRDRTSTTTVDCGNGWNVLTDAKYKACEEQQGIVWVRLLVGGATAYGLFKWGEKGQEATATSA